ncbi:hypothetical protein [Spirosoma agri]|uniref:Uncharacterized protein n=1 Tax=Spirosoma agri TaxID=1987381 RepID=A0A6M0IRY5_9BACT|nr:hypothetical protein [Spirosoma agri]NEU69743.1 hypothetical protein [Spirosoma agri]
MWTVSHRIKTSFVLGAMYISTGILSCEQKPAAVLPAPDPEPAKAIEGTYRAKAFNETGEPIPYPINGQTLTLQIKAVTADTVQVDILATANGKYSPGQTLSYSRAAITSQKQSNGTITYYVNLTEIPDRCGYNTLWIYANKELDYNFIPPGNRPCSGAKIRFNK